MANRNRGATDMTDRRRQPISLDNALKSFWDLNAKEMNTALPATVLAFDATKQQVTVQPTIKAVVKDDTSQEKIFNRLGNKIGVKHVEMPAIEGVPVQYMRAGTFSITVPITVGDTGLLVFTQRSISRWIKEGGIAKQEDLNLFAYSNAIFLPFVPSEINADASYSSTALEIKAGSDKISLDGSNVSITTSGNVTVDAGGNAEINATQADINADTVNLAGGGQAVARVGDTVDLNPGSPTYTQILTGSSKVSSG